MRLTNLQRVGTLLLLFQLSTTGCRLFRGCPTCPPAAPAPPAKLVTVKQRCMDPFQKVTVPTIPAPAEDGSVNLSKQKLGELLVLIDQVLLYIKTQTAKCEKAAGAGDSA